MRFLPSAPEGILDYLLVELMLQSKQKGYRWFNLGIAPLLDVENNPMAPVWHRVGKLIYRQSEHFTTMESLRRFEESFRPVWRAKYLASPGGFNAPRILRDIARLTARRSVAAPR
jgi:phosphatidylglycerol lysyltransferase